MENLGVDIKLLVAQLTNFILFFLIFKKFIAGPFGRFFKEERRKEEEKEKIDAQIKSLHEKMAADEKKFKAKMEQERQKIIKEAKAEGEKIVAEAMQKAKDQSLKLREKMKEEIDKEKKLAAEKIKKETVRLSVDMVETGLKDYLNDASRQEITRTILKNSTKVN